MASSSSFSLHQHHHAFAPHGQSFRLSHLPLSRSTAQPSAPSFSVHGRPSLAPVRFSATPPSDSSNLRFFSSSPRFHLPVALLLVPVVVSLRILFSAVPFDLPSRWVRLVAAAERAEDARLPSHLYQAVVASEDRRFFQHFGVDPAGVSRAILSLSARGGGSTITQQLVKNVFLFPDRKISRKIVEMILAHALERRLSKWQILRTYLSVIYWGHRVYGVEAASAFYFGKDATLLTLGESAMLVGIIPAPDRLSPLKELSRGKRSQARTLRRMVRAGFLDLKVSLEVINEPLYLREDLQQNFLLNESIKEDKAGHLKEIWDWEVASSVWEVKEGMEKWAAGLC